MKVVIAMDSFKGSMTSVEAGNAARSGVLQIIPDAEVIVKPLADGGEGTVDALMEGMQGQRIEMIVSDPLGRKTNCYYGILEDGTAVMEMAQAAGLTKLSDSECNPLLTSTCGVGEMIADAIHRGCRRFVIGIGGSATNDGGTGMLSALGYAFVDQNGERITPCAQTLENIAGIRTEQVLPQLQECVFQVACDVDNPLCGEQGATYIYGPQKGLAKEQCPLVDAGMRHFADVVERTISNVDKQGEVLSQRVDGIISYREFPGAGAAGGLGFAFLAFLHGKLVPGVDLILNTIDLEPELSTADIVLTGEGCLDGQTSMGKAPMGVALRGRKYGCKVLAFAGCIGEGAGVCVEKGMDAYYAIASEEIPLQERMERTNAMRNMKNTVASVFREYADK